MEEDYLKPETVAAFNAGYTLQKHEPQLLDKVLQSYAPKNEYVDALASGKKQFERDKIMEQQQRIKEKTQQKKHNR